MSRKTGKGLSEDDLAIWRRVANTARPMHATPPAPPPKSTKSKPVPDPASPTQPATLPDFRIGQTRGTGPTHSAELSKTLQDSLSSAPLNMDKKVFTRMKRGKLRPERKLDLHGMTLAQAHPALSRFIMTAFSDGCRLVLVVTGKGKDRQEPGPMPIRRGVLRHQVPQWLAEPALRRVVLQVTDAHQSHGGSGAYYIYLARTR